MKVKKPITKKQSNELAKLLFNLVHSGVVGLMGFIFVHKFDMLVLITEFVGVFVVTSLLFFALKLLAYHD